MAGRQNRSISLPPDLDRAIERAAQLEGTTVSAWLAGVAAHRLRMQAGWEGLEAWEAEHGALTPEEIAQGRARARASLGRE